MQPPLRVFVSHVLPPASRALLATARTHVVVDEWHDPDTGPSRAQLLQRVRGVHGLLSMFTQSIDAELLDAAGPQLRVVSQLSVGVNNIQLDECARRNVAVRNTPGVLTDATADVALALLLACARRLPEGQAMVRAGQVREWAPMGFLGRDLRGATLGVVGWGRIGQAVAERARAFGMRVVYTSRTAPGALPLDQLLQQSDFVTLHCDLNASSRHLVDARALALMKDTATLINTARGGCVDHDALVAALRARPSMCAGLDVTDPEPLPVGHPLLAMDNVVVLPHVGSGTLGTREAMGDMAVRNLCRDLGVILP